jgi:hypothetical protein
MPILVLLLLMNLFMSAAAPAVEAGTRIIRFGYLDHPGSALCQIAAAKDHFREEGLQVELVRFTDSTKGLADLEKGAIDVGAFNVADSLRAIAGGKGFGTPLNGDPLSELDESLQAETEGQGIVVLIAATWPDTEKDSITRLTAALIRAYRTHRHHSQTASSSPANQQNSAINFDPNPDYWRLERIWRSLGLQGAAMKRDFLINHVYEEIYCDALDRLLDSFADDQVYKDLSSKAVCTPDCCPKKPAKP